MILNVFLDLIIVLILVIGSYFGYTRGFFRMVTRPMRLILCVSLSLAFCRAVGESLILPLIEVPITDFIKEYMLERSTDLGSSGVVKIPTLLKIAAVIFNLPIDVSTDSAESAVEQTVNLLATPAINIISVALAFLILLLLLRITFNLLVDIADSFLSLGIIGSLNRFFGVVLSCALAFVVAWLFTQSADLLFRSPIFEGSDTVGDFDGGPIYRFFIGFSPLRLLLTL